MSTENLEAIEAAAGDWLARRDSGDWSDADQRRFNEWLSASMLHRVTYLRIAYAWERAQRLQALRGGAATNEVPPPGSWVLSPFFRPYKKESRPARLWKIRALAARPRPRNTPGGKRSDRAPRTDRWLR